MAELPRDKVGRPVPWFVAWIDGEPDFRVIGPGRLRDALVQNRCWLCGQRLGPNAAFVVGPMCIVTKTTAEPGSHQSCATFAAKACPFLTTPTMTRREARMPEDTRKPAGVMIGRNPGVAVVWVSRRWHTWRPDTGGILIDLGDPVAVHWYARGRTATRAEARQSIDTGLPILRAGAENDPDPDTALAELARMTEAALRHLPKAGA